MISAIISLFLILSTASEEDNESLFFLQWKLALTASEIIAVKVPNARTRPFEFIPPIYVHKFCANVKVTTFVGNVTFARN